MSNVRVFKKGEALFKEGDKIQSLFLIQSGSVSVFLQRPKQRIELFQVGNNQVLGESALSGGAQYNASAIAVVETKVVEVPVDPMKSQIESLSQLNKLLIKSLVDKQKVAFNELRSLKMEKDNNPCPSDVTAKVFGSIFHTAKHKGENKNNQIVVNWITFRNYTSRIFGEPFKRVEQALNILIKLKLASIQMVKNEDDPEAPEEPGSVTFFDLEPIEMFFEYFQYYHFKSGKEDLLKTDDTCMQLVYAILHFTKDEKLDRFGAVRVNYPKLVEAIKTEFSFNVVADHFGLLETKGLLVKRQSADDGVFISFDLREWQKTFHVWKVLREVERWNEKGLVDMTENIEFFKKKKAGEAACPSCKQAISENHKFCANCGFKLAA